MYNRSADGTPLAPVPWSFSTGAKSEKTIKKGLKKQKKENEACLKDLMKLLKAHYSYYDLRGVDWKAEEKEHHEKIVGAESTRAWVKETAKMLSAAEDMHMFLSYKGKSTPTFVRQIERNYDLEGVKKVLPRLKPLGKSVQTAQTPDEIGYILIPTLSTGAKKDLGQVQGVLEEFKGCKALIIDLRPNGGGSEPLAMPIAAWFVKGEKTYSKDCYRDPSQTTGWTEVFDRTIKGNEPPKRFDKPVAVLIGPGVMSSAESFALMLKQGEKVTLVGEKTYGSSGNPKPQKLNNGVEIMIPSWKDMLPDGTCFEGKGIKPDIAVKAKAADFKKGDPVIEKALEHLRQQING